jgi:type I restriction enzyme S subunit
MQQGMKQTLIGLLPDDWKVVPLREVLSYISYGFTNPMPTISEGVWMVTASDVKNGIINYETARRTSVEAFNKHLTSKSKPKENDLLLTKDGTLGRVAIVGKELVCINQSIAVLRTNNHIDVLFLKYLLQDTSYQKVMIENAGGSTIKHIYITVVVKMPIALPSLSQQQAIAQALSDADAWIESLEALLEKKRLIKQGAMQELLRPKEGWEVKKLGDIAEVLDQFRQPLNELDRSKMVGTIPYCGANGIVDYINDFSIDDDIILVAEDGGYFDEFATRPIAYRMRGKCWVNNHAHILRSKNILQSFLFYNLVHKDITGYINGGTRAKLNKSELVNILVSVPTAAKDQLSIANTLEDMDVELELLQKRLSKARQIKQGMMHQLLTGKIRLAKFATKAQNQIEEPTSA